MQKPQRRSASLQDIEPSSRVWWTNAQRAMSTIFFALAISCFFFSGIIGVIFESFGRPRSPNIEKGFISLAHDKMGDFYGTPLEAFFGTGHGPFCALCLFFIGTILSPEVWRGEKPIPTERLFGSVAILSFGVFLAVWWRGF
ncbi:hypothetical protein [Mesorhizobium salmacidum]|uniref:Uncharacterized protein n=1 Tax=Mesorhizobium salmacidum TaxID=3015171 RepID=A0ABU8KWI2_9HYPH